MVVVLVSKEKRRRRCNNNNNNNGVEIEVRLAVERRTYDRRRLFRVVSVRCIGGHVFPCVCILYNKTRDAIHIFFFFFFFFRIRGPVVSSGGGDRLLVVRSRQRRFPARDDRAPPAENNKHQMLFLPVARVHRVFPRVRHFRRGVRVRRVRALLLVVLVSLRRRKGIIILSSSCSTTRERGRRESAQSRDAGHLMIRFER